MISIYFCQLSSRFTSSKVSLFFSLIISYFFSSLSLSIFSVTCFSLSKSIFSPGFLFLYISLNLLLFALSCCFFSFLFTICLSLLQLYWFFFFIFFVFAFVSYNASNLFILSYTYLHGFKVCFFLRISKSGLLPSKYLAVVGLFVIFKSKSFTLFHEYFSGIF